MNYRTSKKICLPVLTYYEVVWGNRPFDLELVESWCKNGNQIEIEVKEKIENYK